MRYAYRASRCRINACMSSNGAPRSVARCWEGLLAVQFPDRRFTVEVYGDSPSELDPEITFYTSIP